MSIPQVAPLCVEAIATMAKTEKKAPQVGTIALPSPEAGDDWLDNRVVCYSHMPL